MGVTINMIGTGVRIWVCDIEKDLFLRIDKKRGSYPLELALFNFDFLELFGISHWSELSGQKELMGFYLNSENRIEIKRKAKKLAQFPSIELLPLQTLFPLYETSSYFLSENESEKERIILMEVEIGLFSSFTIKEDRFTINDLTSEILKMNGENYVTGFNYMGDPLISKKNDTVHRGVKIIAPKKFA